jgi:hypothetical protein
MCIHEQQFQNNYIIILYILGTMKILNFVILAGPTRALQMSPPPPWIFIFSSLSLSFPNVFGSPVILLVWQRCLRRRKILKIV